MERVIDKGRCGSELYSCDFVEFKAFYLGGLLQCIDIYLIDNFLDNDLGKAATLLQQILTPWAQLTAIHPAECCLYRLFAIGLLIGMDKVIPSGDIDIVGNMEDYRHTRSSLRDFLTIYFYLGKGRGDLFGENYNRVTYAVGARENLPRIATIIV